MYFFCPPGTEKKQTGRTVTSVSTRSEALFFSSDERMFGGVDQIGSVSITPNWVGSVLSDTHTHTHTLVHPDLRTKRKKKANPRV